MRKNNSSIDLDASYVTASPTYPGEYNPRPDIREWFNDHTLPGEEKAPLSAVNLSEYDDCFRLEAALPGADRQCIFIKLQDHLLSILTLIQSPQRKNEQPVIHEFESYRLERNVFLPDTADTEFLSAEYKQGILYLHLPKTSKPIHTGMKEVVVY